MDDDEIIIKKVTINDDSKNIYHHIDNINKNVKEAEKIENENSKTIASINKYLLTVAVAAIIYIVCAWTAQVQLAEIIDIELPLVALLALIITFLADHNYRTIGYIGYLIITVATYLLVNPSYAFIIVTALIAQVSIDCINQIYINKHDFKIQENSIIEENTTITKRIVNYFQRIKYHILLSLVLFIAFTLLGFFYPSVFQSIILPAMQGLQQGVQQGTVQLETIPLFINNYTVAFNMFLGGVYLSIPTLYLLIYNALLIGFTGTTVPLPYFLSFTLPHGVVELTAIILAGGAGFRITQAFLTILSGIKRNDGGKFSDYFVKGAKMAIDSIILMIIIMVLLLIAAFIEANLTIAIGTSILGGV